MMKRQRKNQLDRDLALIKLGHARSYLIELQALLEEMEPMLTDAQWAVLKRIFMSARENYAGNNQVMSEHLGISPTAIGRFPQRTYKPYVNQARPVVQGLISFFDKFVKQFEEGDGSILPPGWRKVPPSDELARDLRQALERLYNSIRGSNSLLRTRIISRSARDDLVQQIFLVINLLDTKLVELGALMSLSRSLQDLDRRAEGEDRVVASSAGEAGSAIDEFVSGILSR